MTHDLDVEEKSQELADRVPRPRTGTDPRIIPFDADAFEKHRAVLRREANVGRLVLVLAIFLLLVGNLVLTRRSTQELSDNINWARQGQGTMEDDVVVQLRAIEAKLAAIEEQNRQLLERLPAPAVAPAPGEP